MVDGGINKRSFFVIISMVLVCCFLLTITAGDRPAAAATIITNLPLFSSRPGISIIPTFEYNLDVKASASPNNVTLDKPSTISIEVRYVLNNTLVKSGTVTVTRMVSGSEVIVGTAPIGSNGKCSITFTSSTPGTYTLTAKAVLGKYSGSTDVPVVVRNDPPVASFIISNKGLNGSGKYTFDASGSTDTENNIDSYYWTFGDGNDGVGKIIPYTYTKPGNFNVTLTVSDKFGAVGSKTMMVLGLNNSTTPSPSPSNGGFDILIVGVIVLVLIIALISAVLLLLLWLKKTLKVMPKQSSLPCDGKSSMPVRVQFVNGFGMAKKMNSDTDVELESTAGAIQGVTIQAGKEYADAKLTSSAESGPVMITAKAKGKSAEAHVNFTYKKASIETQASPAEIMADGKSSSTITAKFKDENNVYFSFIGDKMVQFNTNLGTITSPVKLPPKTPSATATLTSGDISGVAAILVTLDDLRGETKVSFKGVPKKYCMHCGEPNSLEEEQCHKCGLTHPSGMDTKRCAVAECGTVLPDTAKYCYKCGARQPDK